MIIRCTQIVHSSIRKGKPSSLFKISQLQSQNKSSDYPNIRPIKNVLCSQLIECEWVVNTEHVSYGYGRLLTVCHSRREEGRMGAPFFETQHFPVNKLRHNLDHLTFATLHYNELHCKKEIVIWRVICNLSNMWVNTIHAWATALPYTIINYTVRKKLSFEESFFI